ncbi:bactofilin family protein [Pleomorphovibrio marinus]|uniref:bactofilin family protein n=1 Tax=Pleomorphovibrio marinus TaxID=2164132 RepID=UPI000E0A262F|nr:polymer-forming cytoskeletal protein [Pleomorphovibrio marinus]
MWSKEKKIQEEINLAHTTSVFAEGLDVVGDIEAESDLRIEGEIQGNVTSKKKIIIGISGKVLGNISAGELCVMGLVHGEMHIGGLAKFTETAKVKGIVYSTGIAIEAGADMEVTLNKIKPENLADKGKKSSNSNFLKFGRKKPNPKEDLNNIKAEMVKNP